MPLDILPSATRGLRRDERTRGWRTLLPSADDPRATNATPLRRRCCDAAHLQKKKKKKKEEIGDIYPYLRRRMVGHQTVRRGQASWVTGQPLSNICRLSMSGCLNISVAADISKPTSPPASVIWRYRRLWALFCCSCSLTYHRCACRLP